MVTFTNNRTSFASFYPPNWPFNPFHVGEVQVQQFLGVQEQVMSYAPKFVRPYMPDQHREFYSAQPFLVVAARDVEGKMWSTLLFGENEERFVSSPDPTRLSIRSRPLAGDALEDSLQSGSDVGILGIEFATRRRNRVNGRLIDVKESKENNGSDTCKETLEFRVDQSFGNCPQYIKPRSWWYARDDESSNNNINQDTTNDRTVKLSRRSKELSKDQVAYIEQAESIFIATGYRGEGNDPRFGNDSSHRGGSAGFLKVVEEGGKGRNKILLPDYSGNNHYNTIGNLQVDPRMGITIPLFETGGMLQLTGTGIVEWDEERAKTRFVGAKRVIEFTIDEIVELPSNSLPIKWSTSSFGDEDQLQVQVVEKIKESSSVTSFHLAPVPGDAPTLPSFRPGQHLSIIIPVEGMEESNNGQGNIVRSYSLSGAASSGGSSSSTESYRISVKRHPFGLVSRYLHDHVQVGDILNIQKPTGDFVYDNDSNSNRGSSKLVIFLSAGIGVTPVLSMLYRYVEEMVSPTSGSNDGSLKKKNAYWIHSAINGKHHAFQDEVAQLSQQLAGASANRLKTHIAYTRPNMEDDKHKSYDSHGRINVALLKELLGNELQAADFSPSKDVDVYMCGTSSFLADMETNLVSLGISESNIHFESF